MNEKIDNAVKRIQVLENEVKSLQDQLQQAQSEIAKIKGDSYSHNLSITRLRNEVKQVRTARVSY